MTSALIAVLAFGLAILSSTLVVGIVCLLMWLITRAWKGYNTETFNDSTSYSSTEYFPYVLLYFTSFVLFFTTVGESIQENAQGFYDNFVRFWYVYVGVLIAWGVMFIFTEYNVEVMQVLTFVYNCDLSVLLNDIIEPILNIFQITYATVIPFWNAVYFLLQYLFFGPLMIFIDCEEAELATTFGAGATVISSFFLDTAFWIESNPLRTEYDLRLTSMSIGNFSETLVAPLTCTCADGCVVWEFAVRPLTEDNFPEVVTSAVNVPVAAVQDVTNAIVDSERFTFNRTFTYLVNFDIATGRLFDDYLNSFVKIFVASADYLEGYQLYNVILPEVGCVITRPVSAIIRAVNISFEVSWNIDRVVRPGGEVYLDLNPIYDDLRAWFVCIGDIVEFVGIELGKLANDIDDEELQEADAIAAAFLFDLGAAIRHAGQALVGLLRVLSNLTVGTIYNIIQKQPAATTAIELYETGAWDEFFNNTRLLSQDLGCLLSTFYEPAGGLTRVVLYLLFDLLQIFVQLSTFLGGVVDEQKPLGSVLSSTRQFLVDFRELGIVLGDFFRVFAPNCGTVFLDCPRCTETDPFNPMCSQGPNLVEECCGGSLGETNFWCCEAGVIGSAVSIIDDIVVELLESSETLVEDAINKGTAKDALDFTKSIIDAQLLLANASCAGVATIPSDACLVEEFTPVLNSSLQFLLIPFELLNFALLDGSELTTGTAVSVTVEQFITQYVNLLFGRFVSLFRALGGWLGCLNPDISDFFVAVADALEVLETAVDEVFVDFLQFIFEFIGAVASGDFSGVGQAFATLVGAEVSLFATIVSALYDVIRDNVIEPVIAPFVSVVYNICTAIVSAIKIFVPNSGINCDQLNESAKRKRSVGYVDPEVDADDVLLQTMYDLVPSNGTVMSKCDHMFYDYRDYKWHELSPLEQYTYYECVELYMYGVQLQTIPGLESVPSDIFYNRYSQLSVAWQVFQGVSAYKSYYYGSWWRDDDNLLERSLASSSSSEGEDNVVAYLKSKGVNVELTMFVVDLYHQFMARLTEELTQHVNLVNVLESVHLSYTAEERATQGRARIWHSSAVFVDQLAKQWTQRDLTNKTKNAISLLKAVESQPSSYAKRNIDFSSSLGDKVSKLTSGLGNIRLSRLFEAKSAKAQRARERVNNFVKRQAMSMGPVIFPGCPPLGGSETFTPQKVDLGCQVLDEGFINVFDSSGNVTDYFQNDYPSILEEFRISFNQTLQDLGVSSFVVSTRRRPSGVMKLPIKKLVDARNHPFMSEYVRPTLNYFFGAGDIGAILLGGAVDGVGSRFTNIQVYSESEDRLALEAQDTIFDDLFNLTCDRQNIANRDNGTLNDLLLDFIETIFEGFIEFLDDAACWLLDPVRWANFFDFLTVCNWDSVRGENGIGLGDALLFVLLGVLLWTFIGLYALPFLSFTVSYAWLLSPVLVVTLAYSWSPIACQLALPMPLGPDLFELYQNVTPRCFPHLPGFAKDNGTQLCNGGRCFAAPTFPNCQTEANTLVDPATNESTTYGFSSVLDNILYAIDANDPDWIQDQLDGTGNATILVSLLGRDRFEQWNFMGDAPDRVQECAAVMWANWIALPTVLPILITLFVFVGPVLFTIFWNLLAYFINWLAFIWITMVHVDLGFINDFNDEMTQYYAAEDALASQSSSSYTFANIIKVKND